MTPEVERVIREKVDALPHGTAYPDDVLLSPGLQIPKRTLLEALGVDVSRDPLPRDPFNREGRKAESWSQSEMES